MTDSRLNVVIDGRDDFSPKLKSIESAVIRFVGAVSAGLAAIRIGAAPIIAAAAFERELANVAKTTDFMSKSLEGGVGQLNQLSAALLEMSTKVNISAVDLAKIAAAAGQQGLGRFGVRGVIAFTDSVSRMANVLDITADEAAVNIGKIVTIFKTPLDQVEQVVSTINEVSNRSTASGEELLDVIKRIGDAAGGLQDIQQTAAVAATGLDFGLSPEVVGTSFNKAFSSFLEEAGRYAAVVKGVVTSTGQELDGSAEQWVKLVKTNGLEALKAYLAGLRKLDAQAQQQAIVKLVGGGRIGSLFNKLVQDTTDSVLDRNFAAAQDGKGGLSAIREQLKVTLTLQEQVGILRNTVAKAGIDASESLLPSLTALTAQLTAAIQGPAFQSFINSAIDAIGELIGDIARLAKWVASLNINWENFITVIGLFLKIKLAQLIAGVVVNMGFLGFSLKSISTNAEAAASSMGKVGKAATAAGAATEAAATRGIKGWFLQTAGANELVEAIKKSRKAKDEAAKADAALAAATQAQAAAKANNTVAVTNTGFAKAADKKVSRDVDAQAAKVAAAQKRLSDAQAALSADLAQKLTAREAKSAADRLAIQGEFDAKKRAMSLAGSRVGEAAAKRALAEQLAAEEASHNRSIRSLQSANARKLVAVEAGLRAEIAAEQAALTKKEALRTASATKVAGVAAGSAATSATLAAADAALINAQTRVGTLEKIANAGTGAMAKIGIGVRALAGVMAFAGRVIASGFFWVTLIYSLVDATIGIDKVWSGLQKVTDWLGLSSKASRDYAVKMEEEAKAARKLAGEYEALTEKYRNAVDARTGQIDPKKLADATTTVGESRSVENQRGALSDLAGYAQGALAAQERFEGFAKVDFVKDIEKAQEEIDKLQVKYQALVEQRDKAMAGSLNTRYIESVRASYAVRLAAIQKDIDAAAAKTATYASDLRAASVAAIEAKTNVEAVGRAAASTLTPAAYEAFQSMVIPLVTLKEELAAAKAAIDAGAVAAATSADKAGNQKAVEKAMEEYRRLESRIAETTKRIREFVAEQQGIKKIPQDVLDSYNTLLQLSQLDAKALSATAAALATAKPKDFTAQNAAPAPAPTTGDKGFDPNAGKPRPSGGGGESKATQLARARLAKAKAELEALSRIAAEANQQQLADEQRKYEKGLTAISDYYAARQRLQESGIDSEVKIKQKELEAVDFEIATAKKAKKEVEVLRYEADRLRIAGEITVLTQQCGALSTTSIADAAADLKEFKQRINSEVNTLVEDGVITESTVETFSRNLAAMGEEYKEFIAGLRASGQDTLADAILRGLAPKAITEAFKPLTSEIETSFNSITRVQDRIERAVSRSLLTTSEADAIATQATSRQIPLLESKLRIMEEELALVLRRPGITSAAVAQEIEQIESLKDRIEDLRDTQNTVAKNINLSIGDSINSFLDSLTYGMSSLTDGVKSLLFSVVDSVRKVFVDDLSQRLLRGLGMGAEGGIGKYLAGVLAGGPTGKSPATDAASSATGAAGSVASAQALQTATTGAATGVTQFTAALTASTTQIQAATAGIPLTGAAGAATDVAATVAADVGTDVAATAAATAGLSAFTTALATGAGIIQAAVSAVSVAAGTVPAAMSILAISAQAAATALANAAASAAASSIAGVFHKGGIVTGSPSTTKRISASVFAGVPRYHSGTARAGLKSNEVPAILEKGEAVLTERQQGVIASALDASSSAAPPMNIRNVLVTDPNFVPDSMNSAAGERVLMTFIQRNRMSIKSALS